MALTTVRSTGIGSLPSISGSNLTSLNASNISSGTLNSARFTGGKILQVQTAYGGSNVTINTTSTQNPISSSFYASITPTATSNKLIILGVCDINYSNAGTYHDVGFCYSTDGGSSYVTTNMSGKAAKGYYTGVTRLEGTIEFTTGELTVASTNAHRITFNGMSGNGACDFLANGRSSIIVYEVSA
nr:phage minor structural protein [uncultured Mediterranean phage uvMED]